MESQTITRWRAWTPHPRIPSGDSARYSNIAIETTPGYPRMWAPHLKLQTNVDLVTLSDEICLFIFKNNLKSFVQTVLHDCEIKYARTQMIVGTVR